MSYIQIENLQKHFGETEVLKDIDLTIEEGELMTLLGPSGCGKSTLLRSVAGFHPIDQGRIVIDGQDVSNIPPGKRNIGMVFQNYSLFPNMNVFDNISYGLRIKKEGKDEIEESARELIDLTGLSGKEKAYPDELSGGQKQRVALARALITKPKVLLLDEPLSAVDPKLRKSLQELIRDIQTQFHITTLFVTHDQEEAMILSDRIAIMQEGTILQVAEPMELYTRPKSRAVASFMGSYNVLTTEEFQHLTGRRVDSDVALRPEVLTLRRERGQGSLTLEGEIIDSIPKGNLITYKVAVGEIILAIDQIYDREARFNCNEKVYIEIDESDIIIL